MSEVEQANRGAAGQRSGQGSESDKAGTATGLESSAESRSHKDQQHNIASTGSAKDAKARLGHKTNG